MARAACVTPEQHLVPLEGREDVQRFPACGFLFGCLGHHHENWFGDRIAERLHEVGHVFFGTAGTQERRRDDRARHHRQRFEDSRHVNAVASQQIGCVEFAKIADRFRAGRHDPEIEFGLFGDLIEDASDGATHPDRDGAPFPAEVLPRRAFDMIHVADHDVRARCDRATFIDAPLQPVFDGVDAGGLHVRIVEQIGVAIELVFDERSKSCVASRVAVDLRRSRAVGAGGRVATECGHTARRHAMS
ncbi:hypothetical protein [Burkholderia aenigmatica]|uniref:hypothetical protein n=1 Tax=Burkholderia aenigmatica TaxID=2015348 RepID=UPI001583B906|nr:hypothetical protein [Burkholderia aenigmatica]